MITVISVFKYSCLQKQFKFESVISKLRFEKVLFHNLCQWQCLKLIAFMRSFNTPFRCVLQSGGGGGDFHFSRFLQRITFAVRCKNGFCHSRQLCVRAGFFFLLSRTSFDTIYMILVQRKKKQIRSSNQITNDTFRSNEMNLKLKKRRIISLYFGTNARHVQCDSKY